MPEWNRRDLLRLGSAVVADAAAPVPALSVVRSRSSPTAAEAIAAEARALTRKAVESLGGIERFVSKGNSVWVKPNIGWDRRAEQAATSNPDVVAAVVELCFQAGARKVVVGDNPCNLALRTFARSGIQHAARQAGAQVVFLEERKFRKMAIRGRALKEWEVYPEIVESDRLINVAIVKQHSLCGATLGMKNLMGAVGGPRNRFHQDLDRALADLAAFFKPQLVVLDAIRVLTANGPVGGNLADVRRQDTIAAGTDQVAVDAFGASLLGLNPEAIGHLREAASRGLGVMKLRPVEADV